MNRMFETILGGVFVVTALGFLVYALQYSGINVSESYQLQASFTRGEGLTRGVPVQIAGLRVGSVQSVQLDPSLFTAETTFTVNANIKLPIDTSAALKSDVFSSTPVIVLTPGTQKDFIAPGSRIRNISESVSIEDLVGQFLYDN